VPATPTPAPTATPVNCAPPSWTVLTVHEEGAPGYQAWERRDDILPPGVVDSNYVGHLDWTSSAGGASGQWKGLAVEQTSADFGAIADPNSHLLKWYRAYDDAVNFDEAHLEYGGLFVEVEFTHDGGSYFLRYKHDIVGIAPTDLTHADTKYIDLASPVEDEWNSPEFSRVIGDDILLKWGWSAYQVSAVRLGILAEQKAGADPVSLSAEWDNVRLETACWPSPTPSPTPADFETPTPTATPPNFLKVVFNEFAWMGTQANSDHEWLELFNNLDVGVNLRNWRIFSKDGNPDFTILSDITIPAQGFLVFERGTDGVIVDKTAAFVYPSGNAMDNGGDWMYLEDSNGVLWDEVMKGSWFAGTDGPEYYTMERRTATLDGNNPYNWLDNNGVDISGTDALDNPINGTPEAINSEASPTGVIERVRGLLQPAVSDPCGYSDLPSFPLVNASDGKNWFLRSDKLPLDRFAGLRIEAIGRPEGNEDCAFLNVAEIIPLEQPSAPTPVPTSLPVVPTPSAVSATPSPIPYPLSSLVSSGDYDGDGTSEIALFRPSSGLWAVRSFTSFYFGSSLDLPVSGDYDGDGTSEVALFRPETGLWAARELTRISFGAAGDIPVPADYAGSGQDTIALFRPSTGLWTARNLFRFHFGGAGDFPIPGDYDGDGLFDAALFRPSSGLWAVRETSRFFLGAEGDLPLAADWLGDGLSSPALFRSSSGLWVVRGGTRFFLGETGDFPVPGDFNGDGSADPSIYRESTGEWILRGITRFGFGRRGDLPATR
jgi:hypothetical protein